MFTGILSNVILSQCYGFEVEEHEWVANAALKLVINHLELKIKYCPDCPDGSRCDDCTFKQNLITNNLEPLFSPQTIYLKKCEECRLKYKLCSKCKKEEEKYNWCSKCKKDYNWCSNCEKITKCEKNNSWCSECKKLDITYGLFVKLADYMQTPIDLFSDDTDFTQFKKSGNGGEEVSYLKRIDLDMEVLKATGFFTKMDAQRKNRDHFQKKCIKTRKFWHQYALYRAQKDDMIEPALIYNAFSDHFLQDFFAPGHIRTPRKEGISAYSAWGIHNMYNDLGWSHYEIDPEKWKQMKIFIKCFNHKPEPIESSDNSSILKQTNGENKNETTGKPETVRTWYKKLQDGQKEYENQQDREKNTSTLQNVQNA